MTMANTCLTAMPVQQNCILGVEIDEGSISTTIAQIDLLILSISIQFQIHADKCYAETIRLNGHALAIVLGSSS